MYNLRLFKYQDSYQLRIYESPVSGREKKLDSYFVSDLDLPDDFVSADDDVVCSSSVDNSFRSFCVSCNRSKQKIYSLCRSNVFDWFVTITFNSNVVDRFDYDSVSSYFSKWLNNCKSRFAHNMKYVVVPEQHKNGAWHFHGLFADCDNIFVYSGLHDNCHREIFNISCFNGGFTTATKIDDSSRASSYILKYLNKDLYRTLFGMGLGRKRYWSSRNLLKPDINDYIYIGSYFDLIKFINITPDHISTTTNILGKKTWYLEFNQDTIDFDSLFSVLSRCIR